MASKNTTQRFRGWVFTINNPVECDFAACREASCQYIAYSEEVAPSTGTPHLQGFVYWTNAKTREACRKALGGRAHVEVMLGSFAQNEKYCTKSNDGQLQYERGVRPLDQQQKGAKEVDRWRDARDLAKEGRFDEIDPSIYIRCKRNLDQLYSEARVTPNDAGGVTGVWIYGLAGAGKSWYARREYPGAYWKGLNKWWDGYKDEEFVLVEDIDPHHSVMRNMLKLWTDRYAFRGEVKGGSMMIRPKKVIFTSQYAIEDCFCGDKETIDALLRRCEVIKIVDNVAYRQ